MSDENVNALLDEDLIIRSNSLSGVVSNWSSAVSSMSLGSVNILSDYASLIENGIGNDLFSSLDESIKSIDMICASISGSISLLIEEQAAIDSTGQQRASNRTSFAGTSGNYNNEATPASYEETEKKEVNNDELIKEFNDHMEELSEYEHILLIKTLLSISGYNLKDLLYGENFDLLIKFQNELKYLDGLSSELKEILIKMEPQQLQVLLRNMFTDGSQISDFSKIIISTFDDDEMKEDMKESSENILKAFEGVSYDNIQEDMKKLYNGNAPMSVSDRTIFFTRHFIDTLSSISNVSSETLLTEAQYVDTLKTCSSDLIKTFSYINAACGIGNDAISTLMSNITVRG